MREKGATRGDCACVRLCNCAGATVAAALGKRGGRLPLSGGYGLAVLKGLAEVQSSTAAAAAAGRGA